MLISDHSTTGVMIYQEAVEVCKSSVTKDNKRSEEDMDQAWRGVRDPRQSLIRQNNISGYPKVQF